MRGARRKEVMRRKRERVDEDEAMAGDRGVWCGGVAVLYWAFSLPGINVRVKSNTGTNVRPTRH
jgi:hypothetical protein